MSQELIESWHEIVESGDVTLLRDVLSEDVVFHSPVVHTPQVGKGLALMYLSEAFKVLKNESFHYVREIADGYNVVLEFKTEIEGIEINGVDLIR